MSKILDFSGDNDFYSKSSPFLDRKRSNDILSLGCDVDVLFPLCKKSRICAPFVFSDESFAPKQPSIEVLPDECLIEIFRRLPGGEEKSACACVSKHWLMLLSSIRAGETCAQKITDSSCHEGKILYSGVIKSFVSEREKATSSDGIKSASKAFDNNSVDDGHLSRCLEGKKATDVRLAAIAVGAANLGGLGKLLVHGCNTTRGVTDAGLKAIACGCPSLTYLSLWHIPSIGDEGLLEIAKSCRLLETLDLCHCPGVTDKGLQAIANNCLNLTSLVIESCSNIGDEGLMAIARSCPSLRSVTIKNCMQVGDQGVSRLFTSGVNALKKVRLEAVSITDVTLAVIGRYGSSLTDLVLSRLPHVNERGFWVMGSCKGLVNLHKFAVTACRGMTDKAVEVLLAGSPRVKQACFRKCVFMSDKGLVSFVRAAESLECLRIDECHMITQLGFLGVLLNCASTLKALALINCYGIKDLNFKAQLMTQCQSLRSLCICNCPGFGNDSLSTLASICPNITHIELNMLTGITDEGILPLVESSEAGLVKVKLSQCTNVTDKVVSDIAKLHGGTLEILEVDRCGYITDASLYSIARYCSVLNELDVTNSKVTDAGIAALANDVAVVTLRILSLADCSLISDNCLASLLEIGVSLEGLNIQNCHGISRAIANLLVDHLWACNILY